MLWSILVCGIPERFHSVHKLLMSLLEHQSIARMPDVELLYLLDNRRRSVGAKRNDLLSAARGEYVCWIDDDDEVSTDYVQRIYRAIVQTRRRAKEGLSQKWTGTPWPLELKSADLDNTGRPFSGNGPADVICFPQRTTIAPHGIIHECTYSLAYWRDRKPEERRQLAPSDKPNTLNWTGPPSHTMVWRREILEGLRFPDKTFGEDTSFVDAACERAKNEVQIVGAPLYFYNFDETKSMTRG